MSFACKVVVMIAHSAAILNADTINGYANLYGYGYDPTKDHFLPNVVNTSPRVSNYQGVAGSQEKRRVSQGHDQGYEHADDRKWNDFTNQRVNFDQAQEYPQNGDQWSSQGQRYNDDVIGQNGDQWSSQGQRYNDDDIGQNGDQSSSQRQQDLGQYNDDGTGQSDDQRSSQGQRYNDDVIGQNVDQWSSQGQQDLGQYNDDGIGQSDDQWSSQGQRYNDDDIGQNKHIQDGSVQTDYGYLQSYSPTYGQAFDLQDKVSHHAGTGQDGGLWSVDQFHASGSVITPVNNKMTAVSSVYPKEPGFQKIWRNSSGQSSKFAEKYGFDHDRNEYQPQPYQEAPEYNLIGHRDHHYDSSGSDDHHGQHNEIRQYGQGQYGYPQGGNQYGQGDNGNDGGYENTDSGYSTTNELVETPKGVKDLLDAAGTLELALEFKMPFLLTPVNDLFTTTIGAANTAATSFSTAVGFNSSSLLLIGVLVVAAVLLFPAIGSSFGLSSRDTVDRDARKKREDNMLDVLYKYLDTFEIDGESCMNLAVCTATKKTAEAMSKGDASPTEKVINGFLSYGQVKRMLKQTRFHAPVVKALNRDDCEQVFDNCPFSVNMMESMVEKWLLSYIPFTRPTDSGANVYS
ncbi:Uncharacterised protein g566 [Pycnogonum litorale]